MSRKNPTREKNLSIEAFNQMAESLPEVEIIRSKTCVHMTTIFGVTYYASLTGDKESIPTPNVIGSALSRKVGGSEHYLLKDVELYGHKEVYDSKGRKHTKWDFKDPGGFSYVNKRYARKWLKCYSYDVNSAYSYAMLKPMPDTDVQPIFGGAVKTGQIGFNRDGSVITARGGIAEVIFPLKTSIFDGFINHYYEKKKNAKSSEEKACWKSFLNISTGLMQRYNIFIRLAIIYYAREYIKQFIDKDTVYCNVDSIVSLKRRTDIPLGENIGEFKEEHINEDFKFIDSCIYQWGTECHYKGIPGCTLTDIENIEGWGSNLPYTLENRRIVKNEKK